MEVVQFYEASPGKHLICVYDIYIYISFYVYITIMILYFYAYTYVHIYINMYVYNILMDKIMTNI